MLPIRRFAVLSTAVFLILFGPFLFGYHFTTIKHVSMNYLSTPTPRTRELHLLLPATGPNVDFCKLLLSAAITGYPEPILIGWDGRGIFNGTESHLFKITETLTYLRSLPDSADDDLVLILDAYDIWLQLRPDVLLARYDEVIAKNDARVRKEGLLHRHHAGADIHHSIVFGPDKIHWPQGDDDAATWAVPPSYLPPDAFGPATDTDMITVRPRWLNSGTILGPARDMRDLFSATVDMLSARYDAGQDPRFRNSDQFYFAEVWAEQEIRRARLRDGPGRPRALPDAAVVPDIPAARRTEYHICLDYGTDLFQTATAFERHLTWMAWDQSRTHPDMLQKPGDPDGEVASGAAKDLRVDRWSLKPDVLRSRPPFADAAPDSGVPRAQPWAAVPLGTNVVVQDVFPLFHVTGDKSVRQRWWPRMWFHPHAEALLRATKRKQQAREEEEGDDADEHGGELKVGQYEFARVGGVRWRGALPITAAYREPPEFDEKGGAWRDRGDYVPWADMCGEYETTELYVPPEEAGRPREL